MKPTKEQSFYEAMRIFTGDSHEFDELTALEVGMLRDAIRAFDAATTPDPGPPRPDDMVELARQVAKELRSRGIWADTPPPGYHVRIPQRLFVLKYKDGDAIDGFICILLPKFDGLGPREIAEVIQAEEAAKAKEWAGDE